MTKQECDKEDNMDNTDGRDHKPKLDPETVEEKFMAAIENGNVNELMDMITQKEMLNLDIDYMNDNGQTHMRLAIASGYAGELFPSISTSLFVFI